MTTRRPSRTVKRGAPLSWRVLIHRVPTEPASKRVAVWRDLKRLGALYLQQCACIFPDIPGVTEEVNQVAAKIPALGGETFLLDVPKLQPEDEARIIEAFRTQRASEYAEIIEECETKFVKEIEFERFRHNYTFEEAEEIEQDLEKIRRWCLRIVERDWFAAPRRAEAEAWIDKCQLLLEAFEHDVYERDSRAHASQDTHAEGLDRSSHSDGGQESAPPRHSAQGRRAAPRQEDENHDH